MHTTHRNDFGENEEVEEDEEDEDDDEDDDGGERLRASKEWKCFSETPAQ